MSDEQETTLYGDEFIAEVMEKWRPRFVANGIVLYDLERLERRINSWEEWCASFAEVGREYEALGEEALSRGDELTAGEFLRRASMYYHFGSHYWHLDEDYREEIHRKAVDAFRRGGQYLDPPIERIEAPYPEGGYNVPGNLRVPEAGPGGTPGDSPLVILLPGGDSHKEELHWYGTSMIDRGLATLAVDGAAQGETWYNQALTPDYYKLISAVIDHVVELDPPGVDPSRLGVYGVSRGGYYAPHVAANDDRFDACVGVSGRMVIGPISSSNSELSKDHYKFNCKTDSIMEVDEITEQMTLRGDLENLTAPALMMTGARDDITPPAQTERIAKRAPGGEFVLYEEGNHVCNNIPHKSRSRAADWLRDTLA